MEPHDPAPATSIETGNDMPEKNTQQASSEPVGSTIFKENMVNLEEGDFSDGEGEEETENTLSPPIAPIDEMEEDSSHPSKRQKKSEVWKELTEPVLIKGKLKVRCIHCNCALSLLKSKSTTHFKRHLDKCAKRAAKLKQQKMLNYLPSDITSTGTNNDGFVNALHDGKFDKLVMRDGIAHWIVMHEHPFRVVEEEGFNLMWKRVVPQWQSISRHTIRNDSFKVYETEKKKLKALLKTVDKISLTTYLWKSKPQKIEYMVLTAHFVDSNWKLQKRVLNFVHLPPPRRGVDIANCIYKCLKEWEIENKVYTISVDNASANDACIKVLKETFSKSKKLLCGGKLFHVRCCAHILNLMVQHGLKQVQHIIEKVHDSVDYLNKSDARLKTFAEISQQFQIRERKLVLECKTRWNSTYDMLACALIFKEVFQRLDEEDPNYTYNPNVFEWEKIEKLCEVLKVFKDITNIISGSEYPTSNLFLGEVYRIKFVLDQKYNSPDDFIRLLVNEMKEKFDKYWGECNLLMAVGAVLDPRCKMKLVEYAFPKLFPLNVARENIRMVRNTLYELFDEYSSLYSIGEKSMNLASSGSCATPSSESTSIQGAGMEEFYKSLISSEASECSKSDLDIYLEEGCHLCPPDVKFDTLDWWKDKALKFRILSRMAADILAIPITTVASEATFSAGSRVIDSYRASLAPHTVQMLICTGDWCRALHGVKRKNKDREEDQAKEIILPTS